MGTKDKKKRASTAWGRGGAPAEFKAKVIAYVEQNDVTLKHAADEHGVTATSIRRWFTEAGKPVPEGARAAAKAAQSAAGKAGVGAAKSHRGRRSLEDARALKREYDTRPHTETLEGCAARIGIPVGTLRSAISRVRKVDERHPPEQLALPTVAAVAPRPVANGHSPPRVTRPPNGDYGDTGSPGPSSYSALEDALREAIRERQALRTTLDIFQRENEALRRKLGFGGER